MIIDIHGHWSLVIGKLMFPRIPLFHNILSFAFLVWAPNMVEFSMSAIVNYFVVLPSPASLILLLLCLTGGAKLAFWTEYVGGVPSPAVQRILVSRSEICVVGMKSPKSEHCNIASAHCIVEARTIAEFFSSQICRACPGSFSNAMAELKSPV